MSPILWVTACIRTSLRGDRYDAVRICLGEELLQKMANCRLFMVITVLIRFKATLKNNYVEFYNKKSIYMVLYGRNVQVSHI